MRQDFIDDIEKLYIELNTIKATISEQLTIFEDDLRDAINRERNREKIEKQRL